jgi:hypothetical protein
MENKILNKIPYNIICSWFCFPRMNLSEETFQEMGTIKHLSQNDQQS